MKTRSACPLLLRDERLAVEVHNAHRWVNQPLALAALRRNVVLSPAGLELLALTLKQLDEAAGFLVLGIAGQHRSQASDEGPLVVRLIFLGIGSPLAGVGEPAVEQVPLGACVARLITEQGRCARVLGQRHA